MMDVSDGLLLDAHRMAQASALGIAIELANVPISDSLSTLLAPGPTGVLQAATAGDDYELLFTAPGTARQHIAQISRQTGIALTRIGVCSSGSGLALTWMGTRAPLPQNLGYQHD